jgi:hypothetical protein
VLPEIIALLWCLVFVICVAILEGTEGPGVKSEGRQSPLGWAALLFVAASVLVVLIVPFVVGTD